jgi:predicted amidohydrolase
VSETSVNVAALQLDYRVGESRSQRVERVITLLRGAPRADLLVLPELWDVGFFDFDSYHDAARALGESAVSAVADVARERGVYIVAGSVLERDDRATFNTVALVGPDGKVVDSYRKIHLFGFASRERELLTSGSRLVVAPTPIGNIGLATCFDLRFPEQFLELRQLGADVVVVPAAWPAVRRDHWTVLTRARSLDAQTPLVGCNGVGPCYGVELAGESVVLDAMGKPLASAHSAPGWVSAELLHEATRAWRAEFQLVRPR